MFPSKYSSRFSSGIFLERSSIGVAEHPIRKIVESVASNLRIWSFIGLIRLSWMVLLVLVSCTRQGATRIISRVRLVVFWLMSELERIGISLMGRVQIRTERGIFRTNDLDAQVLSAGMF